MTANLPIDEPGRRRFSGAAGLPNASGRFNGCAGIAGVGGSLNPAWKLDGQTDFLASSPAGGSSSSAFTRNTDATVTDWEGVVRTALSGEARFQGTRGVHNDITYPETPADASWGVDNGGTGSIAVKTPAYAAAPDGTQTAVRVQWNRGAGTTESDYSRATVTGDPFPGYNGTAVHSFWAKSTSGGSVVVAVQYTTAYANVQTITIDGTWRRYATNPFTVFATYTLGFGWGAWGTNGDQTGDILVWHPQVENITGQANQAPGEYVSRNVLSSPWHGAGVDGAKWFKTLNGNTVSNNVVTEATGAPITNANSSYADAKGPFGEFSAQQVTQYLGVTDAPATQTTGSLGTGTYTLWVVGSGSATSSAGTATITGGGAATAGSPNVFTVTGAGTVTVTVAGSLTRFQINAGGFVKPYVPNSDVAGTAATCNADVFQYVSAGNLRINDFTLYGESEFPVVPTAADYYFFGSYVDANNSTAVLWDGTNLIARRRIGGTSHDATIALTPTAGTIFKWAARFSSSVGTDIFLGGAKGTGDSTITACQIDANFQHLADGNGGGQPFATGRFGKIYRWPLTDAELKGLTA